MAQNTRVRLDPDIEAYLRSQSQRVMGIPSEKISGADLTTLTNRIVYEHKLAQTMMQQEFIPRLFSWLKGVLPGMGGKVVSMPAKAEQPALPATEDLDFAADFAAQFEDVA